MYKPLANQENSCKYIKLSYPPSTRYNKQRKSESQRKKQQNRIAKVAEIYTCIRQIPDSEGSVNYPASKYLMRFTHGS